MSFEKVRHALDTLAFRLSVYYTTLFSLSAIIALLVIYLLTSNTLQTNLDEDLLEDAIEYSLLLTQESPEELFAELNKEASTERPDDFFFRLFSETADEILSSDLEPWPGLENAKAIIAGIDSKREATFKTVEFATQEYPARLIYIRLASGYYLQLGETTAENAKILELIVEVFAKTFLLILLLGGITGWYMGHRALAGVEEVTETARNISSGDFSLRVPNKSRGREIEQLATTFNSMLDRIHALISAIRDVTDNIAHDLRSPITSIRGTAETTLVNSQELAEYQHMAGNTIEESDRLLGMINAMLDISEVEAGAEKLNLEELNLTAIVRQACEIYQPLADEQQLSLNLTVPENCFIHGDMKKMQRLVANLIDNALKYTSAQGRVDVSVACEGQQVVVRVEDSGCGIPENELPHIFQRFYRCDQSRSQAGTGLGLSLAQSIAQAHSGKLQVESELGKGSSFFLTIPKSLG